MSSSPKKILIVGPSWVGDMVMAQSLFMTLRQQHPGCHIDVMAPGWSMPILERMPEVARGITMPIGHGKFELGRRFRLGQGLKEQQYDQAFVLPNSLKSALIPFFAEIPVRTGWRGEMRFFLLNDIRLLVKRFYPYMVQRFVALAYEPGAALPAFAKLPRPRLQVDAGQVGALLQRHGIVTDKWLALCPGAEFGPAKRWPGEHYAAVAEEFIGRGWQVVLFGSANDQAVSQEIINQLPAQQQTQCVNLAGQTELAEAVDILSAASAVVSNDSGLMHVAAALARPMVVVYGSTSPEFTPPLSDTVAIEQLDVDCGPCFKRECPLPAKKRPLKCLQDLAPQRIISALDGLL